MASSHHDEYDYYDRYYDNTYRHDIGNYSQNEGSNLRAIVARQVVQLNNLRDEIAKLRIKAEEADKKIDEKVKSFDGKFDKMKKDLDDANDNIRNVQNKTLEPLAVFVGMFTFVSVGFNIFANIKDRSLWISLLLILAGIIIIFSSLVIHAGSLDYKAGKRRIWTAVLIAVGMAIAATGVIMYAPKLQDENTSQSDEQSVKRAEDLPEDRYQSDESDIIFP